MERIVRQVVRHAPWLKNMVVAYGLVAFAITVLVTLNISSVSAPWHLFIEVVAFGLMAAILVIHITVMFARFRGGRHAL